MRSENEVMDTMQMLQPYIDQIAKDIDKDTAVTIGVSSDGNGYAVIVERKKDVEYQHVVDILPGGVATNWRVEHMFLDNRYEECKQEIEDNFACMVGEYVQA